MDERLVMHSGQAGSQINKGGVRMADRFDGNQYPYLDSEDRTFAQCFRLTEDQFLEMAGGLKRYTEFRLNRSQARGATMTAFSGESLTFDVPRLPDNTEEAMALITMPNLKPEEYATHLLKVQMDKVQGIVDTLRANRAFKAMAEREATEKANQREYEKERVAKQNPYGWPSDSQSALDWAEGQLKAQRR